jgi:hypothetical protein
MLSLLAALLLGGCGSGNREGSSATLAQQASAACIGCHNSAVSPVTGNLIVAEWANSAHNFRNGASCNNCHNVDGHPNNGSIPAIPNNGVCVNCHTAATMTTYAAHFSKDSPSYLGFDNVARTLVNPANSPNNTSAASCNGCHNPHDMSTLLAVNQQWAASAHADTTDDPFKEQAFIKNTTCNRCHSGTGFRYYMTIGKQVPITTAILGQYSSAREVIGCSSCHTDYSWNRLATDKRPASPTFTPPKFANFSTPYARFANVGKYFPGNLNNPTLSGAGVFDVGDTKLCIPCHSGRSGRTGASVSAAINSPTDPHYFPAAGVMYMKIGYINFVPQSTVLPAVAASATLSAIPASTYGKSLISSDDLAGGVTSTHRKLGTTAINGDSHNPSFFVPGNLDSGGPCVTCHMTAGHTWQITGDTYNRVCINCHTSERGTPLNASNFLGAFVDENRDQMNNALALAVKLLETNYDITVQLADIESPQEASFVRKSTGAAINWTTFTTDTHGNTLSAAQLTNLKGAMFNIQLGYKENTAFLHARSYSRRFIYDAIDWLDDSVINMSVGATALGPIGQTVLDSAGNIAFKKGTKAFVTDTNGPLDPGTTASMTYLIGFDRTFGTWTPPERERP